MGLTPQDQQAIVEAHNRYRSDPAIQTPPLHWSDELAGSAQSWADHLAGTHQLEHSGGGENIAQASQGSKSPAEMVDMWGKEKENFHPGEFPDISNTGNWADAGHYTQVIWKTTTSVGCGLSSDDDSDYLVCHYQLHGNVDGEDVP